jgi:preprotein translocase SecE subunit
VAGRRQPRRRRREDEDATPPELGGATPWADEAENATRDPLDAGDGSPPDDFDRLPDVAEDEPERDPDAGPERERGKALTFLRASAQELRRVDWPDRRHVFQATAVVLGFVVIAGAWLGLMDAIWQPVMNAIL